MSQQRPEQSSAAVDARSADALIAFRVRLGHSVLLPATTIGALRNAIDQFNRVVRLPGLADKLNPDVIDARKATALVAALPMVAQKSPQLLAQRELYLTPDGLRIGTADPTTAESFTQPFELQMVDVQGETLLARTTVPVVPQMARERVAEAKAMLSAENERIRPLEAGLRAATDAVEKQRLILDELTPARQRRSALARVWWGNARELSELAGASPEAKAETETAFKAVSEYLLPSGVGMPR